jgi:cytochrome c55X
MPRSVALIACALIAETAGAGQGVDAPRAGELTRLVHQDCGACHGMTLKGGLGPDLRAARLAGTAPETIAAIILDGVPKTAMPPWRPLLSEADADWIAHYLLGENSR